MKKQNMLMMAVALFFAGCNSDDMLQDTPEQNPSPKGPTIQVPIHITANGGSNSASKARKVNGTDTGTELTFLWESTDGIEVFAGATGLTRTVFSTLSSGAGTNAAEFDGSLNYNASENGDLALSSTTPLYSYIRNANLVYNAEDKTVTMDLTEQTGSLNDALAHTLFWAETTYGDGTDVHFKYQNQMSVMKFNITNIGTETGTGTLTFIANDGMPNSVTCSAKTGAVTPGTGFYVKATSVTFSNGAATAYLAIVPNATSAITKAEVRIDVNGNTYCQKFKNDNIEAGAIEGGLLYPQNVKKAKQLKVGDVLYKDGTWGTTAETAANKTQDEILGIVGDINPTQEDFEAGYRHGYAIYYEDLPNDKDYDWASQYFRKGIAVYVQKVSSAYGVDYPELNPAPKLADQATIVAAMEAEPSGLKLSQTLYPLLCSFIAGGTENRTAYPAAYYAYGEWGESAAEQATGTHTFLGTAGQMYKVLKNLGILDTTQSFSNNTGDHINASSTAEKWTWANQPYTGVMNLKLTVACTDGNKVMNLNEVTSGLGYYWTTSEDDGHEAFSFYLSDNSIVFEAQQKTDKKYIRPLVAF